MIKEIVTSSPSPPPLLYSQVGLLKEWQGLIKRGLIAKRIKDGHMRDRLCLFALTGKCMYIVCTPTELNRKTLILTPNKHPSSTFLQLTHTQNHMLINGGGGLSATTSHRFPLLERKRKKGNEKSERKGWERERRERKGEEEKQCSWDKCFGCKCNYKDLCKKRKAPWLFYIAINVVFAIPLETSSSKKFQKNLDSRAIKVTYNKFFFKFSNINQDFFYILVFNIKQIDAVVA